MVQEGQVRKTYPSDLTDAQGAIVAPMIPPATQSPRGGRPRQVNMRDVLHTLLYLNRSGCPWDMVPHDLLPQSTVYASFGQWRDDGTGAKLVEVLRKRTRVAAGREPTPSVACLESQAVKTTEMGSPERGADGGKKSNGRKRPLLVDTLGVLLAVLMTRAGLDEGVAAPRLLGHVHPYPFPRLVTLFADQKDHHHALDAWMAEHRPGWRIEVKARPAGTKGCTPLEKRWVIERTNAWQSRCRRNRKDYESTVASSTAMIQSSHRHLMLNRRAPGGRPVFHYRKDGACSRGNGAKEFPDSL
jgi:putative transposase